jgi:hypothetical protein
MPVGFETSFGAELMNSSKTDATTVRVAESEGFEWDGGDKVNCADSIHRTRVLRLGSCLGSCVVGVS